MRLHLMINGDKREVSRDDQGTRGREREVMMPDGRGGFTMESVDEGVLSRAYMDVGLSGKPIQVSRTCQRGSSGCGR